MLCKRKKKGRLVKMPGKTHAGIFCVSKIFSTEVCYFARVSETQLNHVWRRKKLCHLIKSFLFFPPLWVGALRLVLRPVLQWRFAGFPRIIVRSVSPQPWPTQQCVDVIILAEKTLSSGIAYSIWKTDFKKYSFKRFFLGARISSVFIREFYPA